MHTIGRRSRKTNLPTGVKKDGKSQERKGKYRFQ